MPPRFLPLLPHPVFSQPPHARYAKLETANGQGLLLGSPEQRHATGGHDAHRHRAGPAPRGVGLRHGGHAHGLLGDCRQPAGERIHQCALCEARSHPRRLQRRVLVQPAGEPRALRGALRLCPAHCRLQHHAPAHPAGPGQLSGLCVEQLGHGPGGMAVQGPDGQAEDHLSGAGLAGQRGCGPHGRRLRCGLLEPGVDGPGLQGLPHRAGVVPFALAAFVPHRPAPGLCHVRLRQPALGVQPAHHAQRATAPDPAGPLLPGLTGGAVFAGQQVEHDGLLAAHQHGGQCGPARAGGRERRARTAATHLPQDAALHSHAGLSRPGGLCAHRP